MHVELFTIIFCLTICLTIVIILFPKKITKKYKNKVKISKKYKNKVKISNYIYPDFEKLYLIISFNNKSHLKGIRNLLIFVLLIKYTSIILAFALIPILPALMHAVNMPLETAYLINIITALVPFIFIALYLYTSYLSKKLNKEYLEYYKKDVISNFITLVNENLHYRTQGFDLSFLEKEYQNAAFDATSKNTYYNKFTIDDFIEGYLDTKTLVQLFDANVQYISHTGISTHIDTLFQGIVAHVNCNKDIQAYLKISKNKFRFSYSSDKVEMDSQEFEKYFDIYSDNKILAMRLLTSDVMQTLVDFYNNLNLEFEIVIRNNNIYLRFFSGPLFEPKIFGSSIDKDLLYTQFCILRFVLELTQKVNLVLEDIEL